MIQKTIRDKEGHSIMSVSLENITVLNVYVPDNKVSKYMRQKLIQLKGPVGKSTVVVGDFSNWQIKQTGKPVRIQLGEAAHILRPVPRTGTVSLSPILLIKCLKRPDSGRAGIACTSQGRMSKTLGRVLMPHNTVQILLSLELNLCSHLAQVSFSYLFWLPSHWLLFDITFSRRIRIQFGIRYFVKGGHLVYWFYLDNPGLCLLS